MNLRELREWNQNLLKSQIETQKNCLSPEEKNTSGVVEKKETPCLIEPRESQPPGPEEEDEFKTLNEIWKERFERMSDV